MNRLEERGNDMIRAMKIKSDLDYDVKCTTVKFHGNSHNSQSDHWIRLKYYMESPDILPNLGLTFQVNRSLGRHHNTGQQRLMNFVIYFLLTCGLPIWRGLFSYKDVTACFGNLLALQ
jgi:hypothetical protein